MSASELKHLDELLAMASKATKGPWEAKHNFEEFVKGKPWEGSEIYAGKKQICGNYDYEEGGVSSSVDDAEYIAACDPQTVTALILSLKEAMAALEKIADPRKRDHKEPDDYTEKCCLMHIGNEALASINKRLEEMKS